MNIDLTTPALLFPAISLLLLAYTTRFLTLATLIRSLHQNYKEKPDHVLLGQIENMRKRVHLIKHMQGVGGCEFVSLRFMYVSVSVPTIG